MLEVHKVKVLMGFLGGSKESSSSGSTTPRAQCAGSRLSRKESLSQQTRNPPGVRCAQNFTSARAEPWSASPATMTSGRCYSPGKGDVVNGRIVSRCCAAQLEDGYAGCGTLRIT